MQIVPEGKTFRLSTLCGQGKSGDFSGECVDLSDASFSEPGGICLGGDSSSIYVADTNNHCVKRIELSSGKVSKVQIKVQPTQGERDEVDSPQKSRHDAVLDISAKGPLLSVKVETDPPLGLNSEAPSSWRMGKNKGRLDEGGRAQVDVQEESEDKLEVTAYLCDKESGVCTVRRILVNLTRGEGESKDIVLRIGASSVSAT